MLTELDHAQIDRDLMASAEEILRPALDRAVDHLEELGYTFAEAIVSNMARRYLIGRLEHRLKEYKRDIAPGHSTEDQRAIEAEYVDAVQQICARPAL